MKQKSENIKIEGTFKATLEILIHEIQQCKNMDEVNRLLDCWIKANNLHPEKVVTVTSLDGSKLAILKGG